MNTQPLIAKLVQATIDPRHIDEAAQAVEQQLIPLFGAHPGARQGYWMANRATGQVLVMTCWADLDLLEAARAADGKERTAVAQRIGMRVHAVHTLDVLDVEESHTSIAPVPLFARATWVEGLSSDCDLSLRAMTSEVVPMQAVSPSFCASYWLADRFTGNGLRLSLWNGLSGARDNDVDNGQRRTWFERTMRCKIELVSEFEMLGVTPRANTVDLTEPLPLPAMRTVTTTAAPSSR